MKKYLGIVVLIAAILTIGSASAIIVQVSSLKLGTSPSVTATLDGGGCGGHGGCHNNSTMTELTGVLTYDGSTFMIDTTILIFGCYNFLNTTMSPYDFDGDGTIEIILDELLGMVGTTITVEGYLCCQNSRLMVFYINGIEFRECGGQCPMVSSIA